jgi:Zn-dependent peptidase ImmA (M78 family)
MEGKNLYRRVVRNRPWDIKIYGMTDHHSIYLDRTALGLKNYAISSGEHIGVNELKALLNAIPTIAHELAHFLYDTTDNTVEHYKAIESLQQKIAKLYR